MNEDERKVLAAMIVDLVEAHGGTVTEFRDIDVQKYQPGQRQLQISHPITWHTANKSAIIRLCLKSHTSTT